MKGIPYSHWLQGRISGTASDRDGLVSKLCHRPCRVSLSLSAWSYPQSGVLCGGEVATWVQADIPHWSSLAGAKTFFTDGIGKNPGIHLGWRTGSHVPFWGHCDRWLCHSCCLGLDYMLVHKIRVWGHPSQTTGVKYGGAVVPQKKIGVLFAKRGKGWKVGKRSRCLPYM